MKKKIGEYLWWSFVAFVILACERRPREDRMLHTMALYQHIAIKQKILDQQFLRGEIDRVTYERRSIDLWDHNDSTIREK